MGTWATIFDKNNKKTKVQSLFIGGFDSRISFDGISATLDAETKDKFLFWGQSLGYFENLVGLFAIHT
jgi:hypothetical protein